MKPILLAALMLGAATLPAAADAEQASITPDHRRHPARHQRDGRGHPRA